MDGRRAPRPQQVLDAWLRRWIDGRGAKSQQAGPGNRPAGTRRSPAGRRSRGRTTLPLINGPRRERSTDAPAWRATHLRDPGNCEAPGRTARRARSRGVPLPIDGVEDQQRDAVTGRSSAKSAPPDSGERRGVRGRTAQNAGQFAPRVVIGLHLTFRQLARSDLARVTRHHRLRGNQLVQAPRSRTRGSTAALAVWARRFRSCYSARSSSVHGRPAWRPHRCATSADQRAPEHR
jgi:hypothetical protein